jgi:hypothetical protein
MYRKMLTGIMGLMLFGIVFAPQGRADAWDKKTIVTISGPIQVPGKVLPAGTYVFRLFGPNERTVVEIFNADETHLVATVHGIPDRRVEAQDNTIVQLEELSPEQPEALKAWFYPGDYAGVEFVYPTHK